MFWIIDFWCIIGGFCFFKLWSCVYLQIDQLKNQLPGIANLFYLKLCSEKHTSVKPTNQCLINVFLAIENIYLDSIWTALEFFLYTTTVVEFKSDNEDGIGVQ